MYVLDLDMTLINTDRFKYDSHYILLSKGFTETSINNILQKNKTKNNGMFNYKDVLKDFNLKESDFDDIWNRFEEYVFKDAKNFLINNNDKKVILTFGDPYFQLKKIQHSGINKYVDDIIISKDKSKNTELTDIYSKYKKPIIYIDDNIFVQKCDFNFDIEIVKIDRINNSGNISSFEEIKKI